MLAALKAASAVKRDSQSHATATATGAAGTANAATKPSLTVDTASDAASYSDAYEPADGLQQYASVGSYGDEGEGDPSMQLLRSGMVVAGDGGAERSGQPRLFRRLPKRRRTEQGTIAGTTAGLLLGDGQSTASSSNETNQATLYDEKSTPATSSSDEAEQAQALQDSTLVAEDGHIAGEMKELDGNTVQINMTEFTKACQDGRGAEFLRERGIDLEQKDGSASDLALAAQETTPTFATDVPAVAPNSQEEDLLTKRIELLSLADVDMLVRHVAQGSSFFGGAGVTAVAAGLGLYDQHEDLLQSAAEDSDGKSTNSEEFAKLALWATLPAAIENWISAPDRNPDIAAPVGGGRSTLATLYDDLLSASHDVLTASADDYHEKDDDFYPDSGGNHDAFDANDRERWQTRNDKSQFGKARRSQTSSSSATAIPGSSNTKKRKIPSAGPSHAEDSPMASPKISKRDENPFHSYGEPSKYSLTDQTSLFTLADEILGAGPPAAAPRPKGSQKPLASSRAFKRGQSPAVWLNCPLLNHVAALQTPTCSPACQMQTCWQPTCLAPLCQSTMIHVCGSHHRPFACVASQRSIPTRFGGRRSPPPPSTKTSIYAPTCRLRRHSRLRSHRAPCR